MKSVSRSQRVLLAEAIVAVVRAIVAVGVVGS
jgi:hypothetical protein